MAALDAAWAPLARHRSRRLRRRSQELATAAAVAGQSAALAGRWHARRAHGLGRSLRSRCNECGLASVARGDAGADRRGPVVVVACKCGPREVPVACKQRWLCPECRQRTYRRMRAKLNRAVRAVVRASRAAWHAHGRPAGRRRDPVLVTMTVRHSGNLARDRERITRGWEAVRKWVHRRIGLEHADERRSFDYALVWEVTPGADGLGHVHAHAVVMWPWVDWDGVRATWLRATACEACGGLGRRPHRARCALCAGTGSHSSGIDLRAPRAKSRAGEGQVAANYLAKYTSKGVQLGDFTPALAANVLDSLYGHRLCTTSRGFWQPAPPCVCRRCASPWHVVERPSGGRRDDGPVWGPRVRVHVVHESGAVEEHWFGPDG